MIDRLAIIGVGLLGGSVAKAARTRGIAREIVGIGRSLDRLQPALNDGVLDRATTDLAAGVAGADFVLLGATVLANETLLPAVWAAAAAGARVTDVGSTKRGIVRDAERLATDRGDVHFVGSHPMAGSEQAGYAVARADLFAGATVVVTPTKRIAEGPVDAVCAFWRALGARHVVWEADTHDRAVAAISHLPHVVAWALVDAVQRYEPGSLDIAARGFKDTTRIAASDPVVWREILMSNRDELAVSLGAFREALADLERLVADGDGAGLEKLLARIKATRESVR